MFILPKLPLKHTNRQVFYIFIFQRVEWSVLIVSRCQKENERFTETTVQSVPPPNADCSHCQNSILIFDVAMATAEVQDLIIGSDFFNKLSGLYVQQTKYTHHHGGPAKWHLV